MAGSVQPRSCLSVGCARSGRVDGNAFLLHTDEEGARSSVEMVVAMNKTIQACRRHRHLIGVCLSFVKRSGAGVISLSDG